MKFAIVQFPGSNCDDDALHVLRNVLRQDGSEASFAWHKDGALPQGCDAVVLPGGFSYGDYLRAGAIAAHSPIMTAVKEFAGQGGPVLGICNGFQVLCEAKLLDGTLCRNDSLHFECADIYCRVEGKPTPFTQAIPAGRHIKMSIAHAEGRYVHPDVARLENEGRVVFRYCSAQGDVDSRVNPNGSQNNIAGVCNAAGNVVGLMPHPERACEKLLGGGGEDGKTLFLSALAWASGAPARVG